MSHERVKSDLLAAGLHEASVERLVNDYDQMRKKLSIGEYTEAGAYVGNFCENLVNILRDVVGEEVEQDVSVHSFVKKSISNGYHADVSNWVRVTLPRMVQATYELRSKRDTVHTNLDIPVNHADTQTAVRQCTWMLCELLREFGQEDDIDEIAGIIDDLSSPIVPHIDSHNGTRLITKADLETKQEILVHLYYHGSELSADRLTKWIPGKSKVQITGIIGSMKQAREVFYEDGKAKLTTKGEMLALEIIDEHFEADE
ncbi:hypothetical protein C440_10063 [Haloferax mucosum ATCC BAA-1512]|uniref:Uncharacterized protein n=1 Tax=Haloferax mucosum ATCC BAA-1512 TaxID=662479 RepID=M0IB12_9EURY|nr:hypothetical protein [Haloferax mucosum]ELZ93956.1 hypothetical protein C440_10063 [Haloferax mucosum ATCC BAA-1512]